MDDSRERECERPQEGPQEEGQENVTLLFLTDVL